MHATTSSIFQTSDAELDEDAYGVEIVRDQIGFDNFNIILTHRQDNSLNYKRK